MAFTAPQGRILHLQRLSTEDGPGIRTTVFFNGCPLRCAWCHNPESLSGGVQIQWYAQRCLACQTCVKTCPNGYLALTPGGLMIDREHCQACGKCSAACPAGALETLGRTATVSELLVELLRDRAYYATSGGGVTLSGGEPTLQPDFAEALLRGLKARGVSTALDTCGMCSAATLNRLLPWTDLVLFDLKLLDPVEHRRFTGQGNQRILQNLLSVAGSVKTQQPPIELWVRTPLIPGATDSADNLLAIGRFLADHMDGTVARWELCAFNNLCRDKYQRLGLAWAYADTPLMTPAEVSRCDQTARLSGFNPQLIHATGATREVAPVEEAA
jgi:pyruvate formate lyase activating enzyme